MKAVPNQLDAHIVAPANIPVDHARGNCQLLHPRPHVQPAANACHHPSSKRIGAQKFRICSDLAHRFDHLVPRVSNERSVLSLALRVDSEPVGFLDQTQDAGKQRHAGPVFLQRQPLEALRAEQGREDRDQRERVVETLVSSLQEAQQCFERRVRSRSFPGTVREKLLEEPEEVVQVAIKLRVGKEGEDGLAGVLLYSGQLRGFSRRVSGWERGASGGNLNRSLCRC